MIPKITSHEFNKIFNDANTKLEDMKSDINFIKKDMEKKLKILRYDFEFNQYTLMNLSNIKTLSDRNTETNIFSTIYEPLSTSYDKYGCTITPKFKNTPVNLFNIISSSTGEAFYRDVIEVTVNNNKRDDCIDILKHDTILDKELFFEELNSDDKEFVLSFTIDTTKVLGTTLFNMIELDMFLNGSYTIDYIRIYESNYINYKEYTGYKNAGKMRILLDTEHVFYKVDIKITPNFTTESNGKKISPIGIKHIYFYNAKFESDSSIVTLIEANSYIDTVYNNLEIITTNGVIETTIENENIELYLRKTVDVITGETILDSSQEPSTDTEIRPITINTKKIYAKIPLRNKSILGYRFKIDSKLF